MKKLRYAFTLIEVLVSVVILSGSIVYALKIHSDNHEQIVYLTERNKHSLQDSLFLTPEATRYHKEKKDAYEILQRDFKITELKSRELLKKTSRTFFIPEQIKIMPLEDAGPTALVDEIKLKGQYSSYFFHFKISSF